MRISVEGLLRNRSYAQYLSMWLSEKNGIRNVTANHLTGKLLVFFKPNSIMASEILQEICLCRTQYSNFLTRSTKSTNTLAASKTVTKKVTSAIELVLWSIGVVALTFLLAKNVKQNRTVLTAGCTVAEALSRHVALCLAVFIARRGGAFVNDKYHTEGEALRFAALMLLGHVKSDVRELLSARELEVRGCKVGTVLAAIQTVFPIIAMWLTEISIITLVNSARTLTCGDKPLQQTQFLDKQNYLYMATVSEEYNCN